MRRVEMILGRRDPTTLTANLLMEDTVVTCGRETSAVSVAMRLCDGKFGSIPVVDEHRTLSGLVSEFDLLKVMKERAWVCHSGRSAGCLVLLMGCGTWREAVRTVCSEAS